MDSKIQAEDILKHCVKLGFPPEKLPNKQYIEKISRSRKNALLENFLLRADTKQKVQCIRRNILIHLAKDSRLTQNLLPLELQNFLKAMEMKRKLDELEKENEKMKKQEIVHLETIFNTDVRNLKLEKSSKESEVKCDILQAKLMNLDEDITKQEELESKILSVTPPKFAASLKIEDMTKSFTKCLTSLKTFYENPSESQSSTKLWSEIKSALANTPNIFIFQKILKEIGGNQEAVKDFEVRNEDSRLVLEQELIPNLSQRQITSGIELLSMRRKLQDVKAQASESICAVTSSLEAINNSCNFSFQFDDEDLVGEFMDLLLNKLVTQGKIRHGSNVISNLKPRVDQELANKEFALISQDLRNIYSSIDEKVLTVQQGIAQMYHINEKLNFGKISMMHFVQDLKNSTKFQEMNRTMMNLSMSVTVSDEVSIPMHLNELQIFHDIFVYKFESCSAAVTFELKQAHILSISDEESFTALARRVNCDLSTLNRFLKTLKANFEASQLLQPILAMIEPEIEKPTELSITNLKNKLETNREAIIELLDKATIAQVKAKSHLKELGVLYQYLLTNPLKKFIPTNKKSFEGTWSPVPVFADESAEEIYPD